MQSPIGVLFSLTRIQITKAQTRSPCSHERWPLYWECRDYTICRNKTNPPAVAIPLVPFSFSLALFNFDVRSRLHTRRHPLLLSGLTEPHLHRHQRFCYALSSQHYNLSLVSQIPHLNRTLSKSGSRCGGRFIESHGHG